MMKSSQELLVTMILEQYTLYQLQVLKVIEIKHRFLSS